jgi:hypothetical protein
VQKSIQLIDKYKSQIQFPAYHFIVDNYFESRESLRESVELAATIPQGTEIFVFPLQTYPGTEIYDRYREEGLIHDHFQEIYLRPWTIEALHDKNYYTLLLFFCSYLKRKMPPTPYDAEKIMKFLLRKECVHLLDNWLVSYLVWYTWVGMIRVRPIMVKLADPLHRPRYYLKKYTRKLLGKGRRIRGTTQQVEQMN